ncbi:MAG TPA: biopolymer transporter ExbD [Pirellulales bacterium]|jgi:biopolymer transport protein ExbD|nr:biopolymer transporter ExbD [Pirellulales bacterium]
MIGKRKSRSDEAVELNLASMLDMAFQLLAFFILTFRPAPVEGQISLRLPPPQPVAETRESPPGNPDTLGGFRTLAINLAADANGKLSEIMVGRRNVAVDEKLQLFRAELNDDLNVPDSPFDQVVISVPAKLHYAELMRVVGVCSRQTIGGDPHAKLSKLSLVDQSNLDRP